MCDVKFKNPNKIFTNQIFQNAKSQDKFSYLFIQSFKWTSLMNF